MLEIIVTTPSEARAAEAGGATQLDLKCDFLEAGLTPSAGMISWVCQSVEIPVLAMIRPHARSMVYDADDVAVMCTDIRLGRQLGASGFLLGAITEDGRIDGDAMGAFKDAAQDRSLHVHLAWELTADLGEALETLIDLGVESVRTTGGGGLSGQAEERIPAIASFAEQAAGRIDVVPAGGISAENVGRIVRATGLPNAHAGSSVRVPRSATGVVDQREVEKLRGALDRAASSR